MVYLKMVFQKIILIFYSVFSVPSVFQMLWLRYCVRPKTE